MANGSGLTRRSAAVNVYHDIKLIDRLSQMQRLTNDHPQRFIGEIPVKLFAVDLNLAVLTSKHIVTVDPEARVQDVMNAKTAAQFLAQAKLKAAEQIRDGMAKFAHDLLTTAHMQEPPALTQQ